MIRVHGAMAGWRIASHGRARMKILAEIIVNQVAFLLLESQIAPETALRQLEDLGLQLQHASAEEKAAVREACRELGAALPDRIDPEVCAFFHDFAAEFGLDSP